MLPTRPRFSVYLSTEGWGRVLSAAQNLKNREIGGEIWLPGLPKQTTYGKMPIAAKTTRYSSQSVVKHHILLSKPRDGTRLWRSALGSHPPPGRKTISDPSGFRGRSRIAANALALSTTRRRLRTETRRVSTDFKHTQTVAGKSIALETAGRQQADTGMTPANATPVDGIR